MIKINLLKSYGASKVTTSSGSDGDQAISDESNNKVNFFKNILVMFLGVGALFGYEYVKIPELKSQLNVIQNEINEASNFNLKMNSVKIEIEKYEKDLRKLNIQTEFLQKVQKERLLSVDLIVKMKDIINSKVWLNEIKVTDNMVELQGEAESISDVNEFNNKLAGTPYLKDVLTTSIERKNDLRINLQIQNFRIKASYVDGKQLVDSDESESVQEKPETAGKK